MEIEFSLVTVVLFSCRPPSSTESRWSNSANVPVRQDPTAGQDGWLLHMCKSIGAEVRAGRELTEVPRWGRRLRRVVNEPVPSRRGLSATAPVLNGDVRFRG